jgi:parvulin-like peptidyl-prolyl isomerase
VRRSLFQIAGVSACLVIFAGCSSPSVTPAHPAQSPSPPVATTAPVSGDEIVAIVRGNTGGVLTVHRSELDSALYDAYGLQFLFDVTELGLAKATLAHVGMTLQQSDIDQERQLIFKKLFRSQNGDEADPTDYEKLFTQFLERQHLTRTEFEIRAIKINACLRKIVAPATYNSLPDSAVQKGFAAMYGEKRQIADIQLASFKDYARARERLAAGEPFGSIAHDMSTDDVTAPVGGQWQTPITLQSQSSVVPDVIKSCIFAMDKPGEVSTDPIMVGSNYHIVKLVKVEPPSIVKYDDVKVSVRKQMEDNLVEFKMKTLRDEITQLAQQQIEVEQPQLHDQWDKILEAHRPRSVEKGKVLNQIGKDNLPPTTAPGDRPQATMPGAAAPGK